MDSNTPFTVDDLLLEYEAEKTTSTKKTPPEAKAATETFREPKATTDEKKTPAAAAASDDGDVKIFPLSAAKTSDNSDESTIRLPHIKPKNADETRTVAVSTHTRVLAVDTALPSEDKKGFAAEQLEGQLVMENFVAEPVDEERLKQELRARRQEKVDGFRLIDGGKKGLKFTGEEEETPEDERPVQVEDTEEEELDDFNDYADAEAIRTELTQRRSTEMYGLVATAGLTALLFLLTAVYEMGWLSLFSPSVLTTVHVVVMIAVLCINHRMIASGLKNLLRFKADADTPSAVCGTVGMIYTVAQLAFPAVTAAGNALYLSAAASMGVFAGALGRYVQTVRIKRNFVFEGDETAKKTVACYVDDERKAAELGQPADINGIPTVMYYRKVSFLTRYLEKSYAADPADSAMRWFVPLSVGVSVLCAIGYGVLFPEQWDKAPVILASALLVSMPVWSLYATQVAFLRSCKKALKKGVMIGGFEAVQLFGHAPKALIVDAAELFLKDGAKLHGIKTFSGTRIDEAIVDATAVMIAADGPLSKVFKNLIEGRVDMLGDVDSLAYEQDMGLSAWVGGKRVLIGNRRLLLNHGVSVPTQEYENGFLKRDRHVVYLSTAGELSAMFVVSYLPSEAVKEQLRSLRKMKTRLLVRSCDPNITADMICTAMDLDPENVEMLTAGEGRAYDTLLKDGDRRAPAVLASGGRGISKIFSIVQCCRLRKGAFAALVSQLALCIAAMVLTAFVSVTTGLVLRTETLVLVMIGFGLIARFAGKCFKS